MDEFIEVFGLNDILGEVERQLAVLLCKAHRQLKLWALAWLSLTHWSKVKKASFAALAYSLNANLACSTLAYPVITHTHNM